jgi:magnesium transporter
VPVIDRYNRLVGRITIDDIVDVLQEEANEDLHRMAGIADEEVLQEKSTFRISRLRLPWLIIAFIGQIFAALLMSRFEATIQKILVLTFFIPVIMAMGGNAGIQSSTIVVRSIALAEGGATDKWNRFLRELRVATLNGIIISILIFSFAYFWLKQPEIGVILALAMVIVIINAAAFGAFVPFVLHRLKYDPAIATGPFITTSNDVIGLFIYLGLATLYLNWFQ